jgi:cytochrome b561
MIEDSYAGPGIWIRIQHRFGPRMMEWFSGAVTTTFGLVLLAGDDLFSQPSWSGFRQILGSQERFGVIMLILGLLRLVALIVNGAKKKVTPQIRQIAAGFGLIIWFGVCAGFYSSGVISTWAAIYPWLVIAELTNIHRAAHDQGETRNGRTD